jgi:glycosyltransferase involved in cell wall biosynthesis
MRVGLDTSFLARPPSGIGGYVSALRHWLPEIAADLDLVEIQPEPGWWGDRLGVRGSRFAWEYGASGFAARKSSLDLLHMPMMAAPVMSGTPVVATVHDVIPFVMPEYRVCRAQRANLAVARRAVRRVDAIIAPSHHAAADIVTVLGVPAERVWVTYEAAGERYGPLVDQSAIRPLLDRFQIPGKYVFNIGGLDVRKNLPALIRAFHRILPELTDSIRLVIGGAAHSANRAVFPPLEPLIDELGLAGRVILTGRVSEEEKIGLMQGASLYVTPSLYEGFGLTALEAMACGVPVIASNRTSFPEIVADGGILVEPRVDPLANVMREVLLDPDLAADLRQRGLERAADFDWRKTAEQTVAVYRNFLSRRGG